MKTQLIDDYLARLAAPVGIYLVGCFDKPKWDPGDYRRGRTPEWTADDTPRPGCGGIAACIRSPPRYPGLPCALTNDGPARALQSSD
jgi:hypothetical protein